jgi:hypothetical protein
MAITRDYEQLFGIVDDFYQNFPKPTNLRIRENVESPAHGEVSRIGTSCPQAEPQEVVHREDLDMFVEGEREECEKRRREGRRVSSRRQI